ncbi:PLP-dependent aminotransferase family protein [Cellulosimicrobium composti]|uniref:hypothetical protein n=1 Tax=Cellulosimicrobium composti TaxID=2672572 RepID=UPI001CEDC310|nr:hypothetical protein [Cellulosimicrobium composti]
MTDDQHVLRPTCTRAGVRAVAPVTEEHPCLDGSAGIEEIGAFELGNDGSDPVFAWRLTAGRTESWGLYHLSNRLRTKGWLVPAYPMPDDLADLTVQRIVERDGVSRDLASELLEDIRVETAWLDGLASPMPAQVRRSGLHH